MTKHPIEADSPASSLPHASSYHVPIMVQEVLDVLEVAPGKCFVDGTLGGGGHSEALLTHSSPGGHVIGLDRDEDAITAARERLASFGDRFQAVQTNYSQMREVLDSLEITHVDGVLIDAGVSSHQLDTASRGFSFRHAGPLDMRMGRGGESDSSPTLAEFLATQDDESLARIIKEYGELKGSFRVAKAILEALHDGKLENTTQLAEVVVKALNPALMRKLNVHPATLVFQALRIALNEELLHLERALHAAVDCVKPGGVIAIMCFHSLEDRIIKQGFRALANPCTCPSSLPTCACGQKPRVEILTRKPLKASGQECERNPRARSAVLRAARVL